MHSVARYQLRKAFLSPSAWLTEQLGQLLDRLLIGDDIFISYARRDGRDFAAGLAARLSQSVVRDDRSHGREYARTLAARLRASGDFVVLLPSERATAGVRRTGDPGPSADEQLEVQIDLYRTQPQASVPEGLLRRARRSTALVVVGTDSAVGSPSILREVDAFTSFRASKDRLVVLIDLEGTSTVRDWFDDLFPGLDARTEELAEPSEQVVSFIQSAFTFRRAAERRASRVAAAGALLVVFSILAISAAGIAWSAQRDAQAAQRSSRSRELARRAVGALQTDPEISVSLAIEAIDLDSTYEARDALHRAIFQSRIRRKLVHPGYVNDIAFDPNGRWLAAASRDSTVTVFSLGSQPTPPPLIHESEVQAVAFDRAGALMATGTDRGTTTLWDTSTWQRLHHFEGEGEADAIAFSPLGTWLASAHGESVTIWDTETWNSRRYPRSRGNKALSFSRDDSLVVWVAEGERREVVVGRVRDPWPPAATLSHRGYVSDVTFSPLEDRTLATADQRGELIVWSPRVAEGGGSADPCPCEADDGTGGWAGRDTLRSPERAMEHLAFSPDGRLLATGGNRRAQVWDARTWREIATLIGHRRNLTDLAFSPDSRQLATSAWAPEPIGIWDTLQGSERIRLQVGAATLLGFSPDGRYLVTSDPSNRVQVWDTSTWRTIRVPAPSLGRMYARATFNPQGGHLVVGGGDSAVTVIDTESWELVEVLPHDAEVTGLDFSSDGRRLATITLRGTTIIWDAATWDTIQQWDTGGQAVALDSRGEVAATGVPEGIRLWNATTGDEQPGLGRSGEITALEFSPDGSLLAFGENQIARVIDIAARDTLATIEHTDRVNGVAFGPEGRWLATTIADSTAALWDPRTGDRAGTFPGHSSTVERAAFSPDSRWLATATADEVLIFPIAIRDLREMARERLASPR